MQILGTKQFIWLRLLVITNLYASLGIFSFIRCLLCRCTAVLACVIAVPNNHIILMYSPKYGCPILLALYGYYGQPDYSFIALIYILYLTLNYCAAIENSRQNWNFKILHNQSDKKPFGETFWKITIKVSKELSKPMGKKSGSKKQGHLLQVRIGIPASYNTIWLKILQDNAFCTRLKKAQRFLSLALS